MELEKLSDSIGSLWDTGSQLRDHVYARSEAAFAAGDTARDALAGNPAALRERQTYIRETFLRGIGGLPADGGPLNAKVVGEVAAGDVRIEKVTFESRPGAVVTASLYLPPGHSGRGPAVLFLCGHHRRAKHEPEFQIVCQIYARAGFVVLVIDPPGQGERLGLYDPAVPEEQVRWGTAEHDYFGVRTTLLGQSIARYFLHDAMRGFDCLLSRPEVDPARIAVTGNSGGGTQTAMMMMADPRIAAALPATFLMDRRSYLRSGQAQDSEQIWPGFTAAGLDHEDFLIAMAPRPVAVLAVTSDFFPIEGTRSTVARGRRHYETLSCADALALLEDASDHHYTPGLARQGAVFLARAFGMPEPSQECLHGEAIEPRLLWCTPTGHVRANNPQMRSLHTENVLELQRIEEAGRDSGKAAEWLREQVFANRKPVDLNVRFPFGPGHWNLVSELLCESGVWWSQEGILNYGLMFRLPSAAGSMLPVTLALWDGGTTEVRAHAPWLMDECAGGRAVLVADLTGLGCLAPNRLLRECDPNHFYGTAGKLADDLLFLGDSLAALRAYDVTRALDALPFFTNIDPEGVRLLASGKAGIYGQLAAMADRPPALARRIQAVEVVNPPWGFSKILKATGYDTVRFKEINLCGLLRHMDIPDFPEFPRTGQPAGDISPLNATGSRIIAPLVVQELVRGLPA